MEMGLQDCADRLIGNWHLRGISGGEKKRLSIALEILTRPQLMFLDEPTSGLDSASAFFVVKILKNIAHDGRTIISAIHQPSSEVFALFNDLFLLSGGETVYFGEAKSAAKVCNNSCLLASQFKSFILVLHSSARSVKPQPEISYKHHILQAEISKPSEYGTLVTENFLTTKTLQRHSFHLDISFTCS